MSTSVAQGCVWSSTRYMVLFKVEVVQTSEDSDSESISLVFYHCPPEAFSCFLFN